MGHKKTERKAIFAWDSREETFSLLMFGKLFYWPISWCNKRQATRQAVFSFLTPHRSPHSTLSLWQLQVVDIYRRYIYDCRLIIIQVAYRSAGHLQFHFVSFRFVSLGFELYRWWLWWWWRGFSLPHHDHLLSLWSLWSVLSSTVNLPQNVACSKLQLCNFTMPDNLLATRS